MNTTREQFLERLTRELFKKGDGFVLKGGGALRALYGEQRLTKDIGLDFSNPKRTADSLHRTVRTAIEAAARGLELTDLQVHQPGKAERSPRWKINFRGRDNVPLHVEIEVSREPERAPPGRVVQKPYVPLAARGIPRFFIDVYDEPTLIATKVAALLGRGLPRDVYDLDLLHVQNPAPSAEQVQWAIARAGIETGNALPTLWTHLDALTWDRFETELLGALPETIAARMNEEEWTSMKLRVGEYVEALLVASERPA